MAVGNHLNLWPINKNSQHLRTYIPVPPLAPTSNSDLKVPSGTSFLSVLHFQVYVLFNKLENNVNMPIGSSRAVKLLVSILTLVHITACVWFPLACFERNRFVSVCRPQQVHCGYKFVCTVYACIRIPYYSLLITKKYYTNIDTIRVFNTFYIYNNTILFISTGTVYDIDVIVVVFMNSQLSSLVVQSITVSLSYRSLFSGLYSHNTPIAPNRCSPSSWAYVEGISPNSSIFGDYLVSLYWATTTMTSTGYGEITAHSNTEKVFSFTVMLMGLFLFGYTLSLIAATLTNSASIR